MKRLFDKFKNLIRKKKPADKFENESRSITITNYGTNKAAFNEVVKMFCDEFEKQISIKIDQNDFIYEPPFKNQKIIKFTFPIPPNLSSEQGLLFDVIKKNVQLKIKGVKKYKDVHLIGVKRLFIEYPEIKNVLNIINSDEQLCNFDGPLFLNLQLLFYTAVFDYERFTDFSKKIDKHLNLTKVDYEDIKKRVIDAVEEVTEDMHKKISKKTELSKKQLQNVVYDMGKQGAIKLIYMRNYTWDIDDLKKNQTILEKLSSLMEFMQETLNSEGPHKDFLIPVFELSSDIDFVSACGCFATINDKTGIDESVIRMQIPNRMKEL